MSYILIHYQKIFIMGTITEIQKIKQKLLNIERQIAKPNSNIEILKEKLDSITRQIYKVVEKADKKEREELDYLIILKNIIRAKIEKR
jgi:hypothetical protein